MDVFPRVDPIPLPAPVWLFKGLHTLTLGLHFFAVYFLVGGLLLALWWSLRGRMKGDTVMISAGGAVGHRLPTVMAYVVNLGIPPLLFTQVLYGRALYTSSVVIGTYWLAVVPMVIASYYLLYRVSNRVDTGRPFHWTALIALVIIMKVGYIYSTNMTLMLRPDVWTALYRENPLGANLPGGDPTVMPRWLFMMLGSVGVCGLLLHLISNARGLEPRVAGFLRSRGGLVLAIFSVVQMVLAFRVFAVQPEAVRASLMSGTLYPVIAGVWFLTAAVLAALGVVCLLTAASASWLRLGALYLVGLVNILALVLFRDGIRDAALAQYGFDVWASPVYTNWLNVIIFLLLFVAGLGTIGYMLLVSLKGKGVTERYV